MPPQLYTRKTLLLYAPILRIIDAFAVDVRPVNRQAVKDRMAMRRVCKTWHATMSPFQWTDTYSISIDFEPMHTSYKIDRIVGNDNPSYEKREIKRIVRYKSKDVKSVVLPKGLGLRTEIINLWYGYITPASITREIFDGLDSEFAKIIVIHTERRSPSWAWLREYPEHAKKIQVEFGNRLVIDPHDYRPLYYILHELC